MIRKITLQITFRTSNTIHDIIKTRTNNTNAYMRSAMYQLQCHTYNFSYIGQTGKGLEKRYIEHQIHHIQELPFGIRTSRSLQQTRIWTY